MDLGRGVLDEGFDVFVAACVSADEQDAGPGAFALRLDGFEQRVEGCFREVECALVIVRQCLAPEHRCEALCIARGRGRDDNGQRMVGRDVLENGMNNTLRAFVHDDGAVCMLTMQYVTLASRLLGARCAAVPPQQRHGDGACVGVEGEDTGCAIDHLEQQTQIARRAALALGDGGAVQVAHDLFGLVQHEVVRGVWQSPQPLQAVEAQRDAVFTAETEPFARFLGRHRACVGVVANVEARRRALSQQCARCDDGC